MIKSISFNQEEIINSIIALYCKNGIELDPTYSKGNFYKNITQPKYKFDLYPQTNDTLKSDANNLPIVSDSVKSIMFDPPFLVGYTTNKNTGIMAKRFGGFRYIKDLWRWYSSCLIEFDRLISKGGI